MYPLSPHALALGSPVRMNLKEALLLPQKRARGAVGGGREEGERIRENYWEGKQRWNKIVRQKSPPVGGNVIRDPPPIPPGAPEIRQCRSLSTHPRFFPIHPYLR